MVQKLGSALVCVLMWMVLVPNAGEARMSRAEKAVVKGINKVRAASGLSRLRRDRDLARAADAHSRDMARSGIFSHASSDGTHPTDRIRRFQPAGVLGETLAYTPVGHGAAPESIVRMWVRSPPHLAVMRSPAMRRVGVAKRRGTLNGMRVLVWTADYAGS